MNPAEAAAILRQFNEWRRGDEDIPQFDPREIGEAIDAAVEMIERLEVAESECLEESRLNGMGSEREAALMAKLEAAEKEIALKERAIDALGSELNAVANERDALRAKIAEMEKQEQVAWMLNCPTLGGDTGWILSWTQSGAGLCNRLSGEENEKKLYALPGAKEPEPTRDWWDCLISDISAIDCMYRGSPTYAHDAYWMREHVVRMLEQRRDALPGVDPAPSVPDGWKEAAIAWEVCASIHREYGKGKDPFFNTRQGDFVKHANDARAMLAAAPEAKP